MRPLTLATVLLSAGLLLAACGSSSSQKAPPTPTPLSDAEFAKAARQFANSTLLALEDLPGGWQSKPTDNSSDLKLKLTGPCEELNTLFGSNINYPGATAEASSDTFDSGTTDITEDVSSDAGVFRTDAAAKQFADHTNDLFSMCGSQVAKALEDELSGMDGIYDAHVRMGGGTAGPTLGDQSAKYQFAVSATGAGGSIAFISEDVEVRVGRVVGSVSYTITGAMTQALADSLTNTLVERLKSANAALPN